jgi:hypothetical protein
MQGVGILELQTDSVEWTQRWQAVFSLWGLAPGWAPRTVRLRLDEVTRVYFRQRWLSPELLVIETVHQQYTFKVGLALSIAANRRWAGALRGALRDSGSRAEVVVSPVPMGRLALAAITVTASTAIALVGASWMVGSSVAAPEAIVPSVLTALLSAWAYT